MDDENKPVEAKEEPKTDENNKDKVVVIKKSRLILATVAIIIILSVIGYWMFFNNQGNNKIEYIASDSPVLGNVNATINVVEFSDYECPYCQASEGTNQEIIDKLKQNDPSWEVPIPKVIEEYVNTGKVKLVFRDYPVHGDKNPALASKCAQEQGKFWEYHRVLFDKHDALTITDLKKYAANLNLNLTQFAQCLDSKKYESSVGKDASDGNGLGVSATPTFFIGNNETGYESIVGAQSFSDFKKIIDSKISV